MPKIELTKALDAFAGDVVEIGVGGLLARWLEPRVGAQVEAVLDFPVAQGLIRLVGWTRIIAITQSRLPVT